MRPEFRFLLGCGLCLLVSQSVFADGVIFDGLNARLHWTWRHESGPKRQWSNLARQRLGDDEHRRRRDVRIRLDNALYRR